MIANMVAVVIKAVSNCFVAYVTVVVFYKLHGTAGVISLAYIAQVVTVYVGALAGSLTAFIAEMVKVVVVAFGG